MELKLKRSGNSVTGQEMEVIWGLIILSVFSSKSAIQVQLSITETK